MFDINELNKFPDQSGVYIMKDNNNEIIYIGKANVLKNRVRQYFNKSYTSPKVDLLVSKINYIDYIVTSNEVEALVLENNMIKTHQPKYNVLLKDDKSYPFIKITLKEDFPRVFMTRKVEKDGSKYFGPYTDVSSVKNTLKILKKIFPVKTCNKNISKSNERPCLNYHLNKCLGPCNGKINQEKYNIMIKDICNFLDGKYKNILDELKNKMEQEANEMNFEAAASYRDKINSIKSIMEKQRVVSTQFDNKDVIVSIKDERDVLIIVLKIRKGILVGDEKHSFEIEIEEEKKEIVTSFIKQYYNSSEDIPENLLVEDELDDFEVIEKWLSKKKNKRVKIAIPKRGDKLDLIKLAKQNAYIHLKREKEYKVSNIDKEKCMISLKKLLDLDVLPRIIEAYDVSNFGVHDIVASVIVFKNGSPYKDGYRRFKIKSVEGKQDDYQSMKEAIYRRFRRALDEITKIKEDEIDEDKAKFHILPDIVLIDGGIGHINAVKEVFDELDISIPLFGMVKDEKHRTKDLVGFDSEKNIKSDIDILRFITQIQNEVHRYTIDYSKKLRVSRYKKSVIDDIPGIGKQRKKAIIKHFGSIAGLKKATIDDIEQINGISRELAKKIYSYLRGE